jgi:hypothetical protein
MHVLTNAIFDSACLGYYEHNVSEVERLASNVIELNCQRGTHPLAIGASMNKRFTAPRVPDSGIEVLFATEGAMAGMA